MKPIIPKIRSKNQSSKQKTINKKHKKGIDLLHVLFIGKGFW
jgi:hypothetical protein